MGKEIIRERERERSGVAKSQRVTWRHAMWAWVYVQHREDFIHYCSVEKILALSLEACRASEHGSEKIQPMT